MKKTRKLFRPRAATLTTDSGISCTPAEPGPTPVRASGSWQSCPACDGKAPGSCRTCEGAGVVFAARPASVKPAAAATAAPTMVAAGVDAPPVSPAMRFRVWHQSLDNVDHAYESFDDQFTAQTTTLAGALQLEEVLEAYDGWHKRYSQHDVEVWDGAAWSSDIDQGALDTAVVFVQRIRELGDLWAATRAGAK